MIAALLQAAAAEVRNPELTAGAIAFMLVSITAVSTLTFWCFARVLGVSKKEGGRLD